MVGEAMFHEGENGRGSWQINYPLQPYDSAAELAWLRGHVSPVVGAIRTNANEIGMLMPQTSKQRKPNANDCRRCLVLTLTGTTL